jgi:hypothetical protein
MGQDAEPGTSQIDEPAFLSCRFILSYPSETNCTQRFSDREQFVISADPATREIR